MNQNFEQNIVENTVILKMADLHTLGTTSAGKDLKLISSLFSVDEIEMLQEMGSHGQEQLRDLEQSILINESMVQVKKAPSSSQGSSAGSSSAR